MNRTLTILLGDNQDFIAAEKVLTKRGGTRIESADVVMNNQSIECEIPAANWLDCRNELQYLKYDVV